MRRFVWTSWVPAWAGSLRLRAVELPCRCGARGGLCLSAEFGFADSRFYSDLPRCHGGRLLSSRLSGTAGFMSGLTVWSDISPSRPGTC